MPLPRNSLHGRDLGSRLFCPRIQESRAKFELNWKVPLSRNSLHGRDLGSRLFGPRIQESRAKFEAIELERS